MPSLTFETGWGRFNGKKGSLIISPSELIEQYFHGIPFCDSEGRTLSNDAFVQKILAAQSEIEEKLSIKLYRQIYQENRDFVLPQWQNWGFIQLTYLIKDVCSLEGILGAFTQTTYPVAWISLHKPYDEKHLFRQLSLVPAGVSATVDINVSSVTVGITPHAGFFGLDSIPNHWQVKYETGFNDIPSNIIEVVGKMASIPIFNILGDILLGAGIASQSLAYDGLSESITTTQSAENSAYSARVRQYEKEIKEQMKSLHDQYVGFSMMVM